MAETRRQDPSVTALPSLFTVVPYCCLQPFPLWLCPCHHQQEKNTEDKAAGPLQASCGHISVTFSTVLMSRGVTRKQLKVSELNGKMAGLRPLAFYLEIASLCFPSPEGGVRHDLEGCSYQKCFPSVAIRVN